MIDFYATVSGRVTVRPTLSACATGSPWILERLSLVNGRPVFTDAHPLETRSDSAGFLSFNVPATAAPGYYRLRPFGAPDYALPLPVNAAGSDKPRVALVRPVFTEWSYEAEGFYPETAPARGRLARLVGKLLGRNQAGGAFPARPRVSLDRPYERIRRRDRLIWSPDHGDLRGHWCDEILSAWPIHLLLEHLAAPYRTYSDLDLHFGNAEVLEHDVLVLYGTDVITAEYLQTLERYLANPSRRLILWGCQSLGYREYRFDPGSQSLEYVCTRGSMGLWGEPLEARDPEWDEGAILGFRFPSVTDPGWRYAADYRNLEVVDADHWLIRRAGLRERLFTYDIADSSGDPQPGLLWAGGEYLEPAGAGARVIACLAEGNKERIGIGEYRNVLAFAPTYWPAYWLWQHPRHPEIAALLGAALEEAG